MERVKGIVMIVFGGMLWGATGPMLEWILANSEMSIPFMLSIRLLLAGILILAVLKMRGQRITLHFSNKCGPVN